MTRNSNNFQKGETYTISVETYNEAIAKANEIRTELGEQFKAENPYLNIFAFPFRKRNGRFCVEVWMEYSDMVAAEDIRVEIYFSREWFAAARKEVAKRRAERKQSEAVWSMFGF